MGNVGLIPNGMEKGEGGKSHIAIFVNSNWLKLKCRNVRLDDPMNLLSTWSRVGGITDAFRTEDVELIHSGNPRKKLEL